MNCPTCGAALADGASVCSVCGAAINQNNYNQMAYQQPQQNGYNQMAYQQPQQNGYNQTPYQQPQQNGYNQMAYQQPQQNGYNQMAYQQPVASKPKRKFNPGHFIFMGGTLLCLIAVFLPYATMSFWGYSESVTLFGDGGDGAIFLVLAIITLALSLLRINICNIILALIQGALVLIEVVNTSSEMKDYGDMIQYGAGYYFLLIGGIIALAGAIFGLILSKKNQKNTQ